MCVCVFFPFPFLCLSLSLLSILPVCMSLPFSLLSVSLSLCFLSLSLILSSVSLSLSSLSLSLSLSLFSLSLPQYESDIKSLVKGGKLRIITSRYREVDGGDSAGPSLIRLLRTGENKVGGVGVVSPLSLLPSPLSSLLSPLSSLSSTDPSSSFRVGGYLCGSTQTWRKIPCLLFSPDTSRLTHLHSPKSKTYVSSDNAVAMDFAVGM